MLKRLLDIFASLAGLAITLPLYPFIALAIKLDSPGPVFFHQKRAGLNGKPFSILKFRTMVTSTERQRPISVKEDPRVTSVGRWLRRYEIDELPTLLNVLIGHMSIVGPRPELPMYVEHYTPEQQRVLSVRPGMTDLGTLRFRNETDLLVDGRYSAETYLQEVLPRKLRLNQEYIDKRSIAFDLQIILKTLTLVVRQKKH